jgi:chaperonin GroEL (HSP60 family)
MACISIANIVKTSLGPVGLDKMLVDDIGDTTVIIIEKYFIITAPQTQLVLIFPASR